MRKVKWPGHGWKVTCMRCGFDFPSTDIKKEWTGYLVCCSCYEPAHPSNFIKVKGETHTPSFVNKDEEIYLDVCTIEGTSCYAGLAVAGCALAGNTAYSYEFLQDL